MTKQKKNTHIVEQDEDGFIYPLDGVYVVVQHQPSNNCEGYPLYVMTDEDEAYKYAKALNKKHQYGCKLYSDCTLKEITDEENYHYYSVIPMRFNQELITD